MLELIHEEWRGGLRIRLTALEHSMIAEVLRGNSVIAKSESGHGGLLSPNACLKPHESGLAKALIEQATDKALGRVRRNNFDLLIDDLRAARRRASGSMRKALGRARVVFFAKAQRDPEPASLRAAGLLSRARQHAEATYQPNAAVNDAVLRRVLAAARSGVLTPDDVRAVQQAHRDGRAIPSYVLTKLMGR
ncbi:hypothetical protein [Ralstonia pseudosolanacearum]|uniref:hypothetical protein n=1 Tax=Ralstonia pseudosolanacearum TaxID=1310165 RepID=UPI002675567D|nr:hypothetical protein [Ralstonia pseudosolanacearum]MDO3518141.1 hypothetical protein [Ralstonia pseudosolanacearum]MDO3540660.1 hypothetical protein [Ralstonia pseudosolanacearum]